MQIEVQVVVTAGCWRGAGWVLAGWVVEDGLQAALG